jgi:hypothetical protein
MSHATRRVRRGLGVAAVAATATGFAVSLAGSAAAAGPEGTVLIDTGQLIVTGTDQADRITLRVPAADPAALEVESTRRRRHPARPDSHRPEHESSLRRGYVLLVRRFRPHDEGSAG